MTSTSQSYRISSSPDISNARPAGRTIYTIPRGALSRLGALDSDEGSRGHLEALVADQAIDLRVDWDGSAASLGSFEVLVDATQWKSCELIDPDAGKIDVISLSQPPAGETYLARFRRGPAHGSHVFGVKAVPIVWLRTLPATLDPSFVAERGKDYEYEAGIEPALVPWTYSVLASGLHRLTLELSMTRDYELWVRLQDPNDPSRWQIQDPVIRQPIGGGEPTVDRYRNGPA